jgi:hypothetical protein
VAETGGLSTPVSALVDAVAAVSVVDPTQLAEAVALEDLRALMAAREQLDVQLLARLKDMQSRKLHELDAYPTTTQWAEAQGTSLDRGTVAMARKSERYPLVAQAMSSGRLSVVLGRQVGLALERVRGYLDQPDGLIDGQPAAQTLRRVIVDGVRQLVAEAWGGVADDDPRLIALRAELLEIVARPEPEVARIEAAFVALAQRVGRVQRRLVRPMLGRLVDALLPVRLEEAAEEASRERGAVLQPHADRPGGRLEIELDAEGFELAHAMFAAAMATDPENVADTAIAAARRGAGEEPYAPGPGARPRTMLQRRHVAFTTVLRDWLGSGIAGKRGKVVPHISVVCPVDTLASAPGALPALGGSGATVPLSLVKQLMCDSAVTRFVLSLGHQVIEMSHTVRTLKPHERKAKDVEVGGRCQAAHCRSPHGTRLIPHHPDAYATSGTTSFYDTVMLCEGGCHDDVHVGGHVVRLRDGRALGPEGWLPVAAAA